MSPDEFFRKFAENLRRARHRKGLTQADVAARGISLRYVSEMERGVRNPSLAMLVQLGAILGVRVADLVDVGEELEPVRLADIAVQPPPRGRKKRRPKKSTRI